MAAVDILAAFGYKWAETGSVEALDDAQYKAGWAFIGATPPSVEQFNKVHQIADEKANYLYSQMSSIYTQAGVSPAPGTATSLRDALSGLYASGRVKGFRVMTTPGVSTYTETPGTTAIFALVQAAGGAGGGTFAAAASQAAAGGGGGGGGWAYGYFTTGFAGASMTIPAAVVGVAGAAGSNGGSCSLGALLTATGGSGGAQGSLVSTPPAADIFAGFGAGGIGSVGPLAMQGGQGFGGMLFASRAVGGNGGSSYFGSGGVSVNNGAGASNGFNASVLGAGGGGASTFGVVSAARPGGTSGQGAILIWELS